ncbi:helix-turn-helix domain-containing protein [Novosphingobium olei]|uniref:helix-turn-helix transcriptional regulator n=1 Tax=Novosphingobium olei TaxID=2728851 RepID=UPI003093D8BF|nr:helix-turn-helix domain-containing protein [Novosphingobium olei]
MEILTSPEAARYLKLSERTLAAMRSRGDGPRFARIHPDGRGVRYRLDDLNSWIEARGREHAA